jgi:hypothetical protein
MMTRHAALPTLLQHVLVEYVILTSLTLWKWMFLAGNTCVYLVDSPWRHHGASSAATKGSRLRCALVTTARQE